MKTLKIPASLRVIGRSIVDWWDGWLDMVVITIVWIIAQFTIILGPPATFGIYYVVHEMLNGQALGLHGMIDGTRKFFGRAWVWGALNLLAVIVIAVNFRFYGSIAAVWAFYVQILIALIAYHYVCMMFYALPYYMEQNPDQRSLKVALRNGFLTTLASPFFTLPIFVFGFLVIGASILLILPAFLGLPGLIAVLGFRSTDDRLIAFGLRKREKTPKEIEYEQGGRMVIQGMDLEQIHTEDPQSQDVAPLDENVTKKGE